VLRQIYRPGFKYVKAGILLTELVDEDCNVQLHLFKPVAREKEKALMRAVSPQHRYGRNVVRTTRIVCSTTRTVLPASTNPLSWTSNFSKSAGWRPLVGSSST
jgi:hypothetical protein